MPHVSQPSQPQAAPSTWQEGSWSGPDAPERGQGGLAVFAARAARGALLAALSGLMSVLTLLAMPEVAQAQTAQNLQSFDGKYSYRNIIKDDATTTITGRGQDSHRILPMAVLGDFSGRDACGVLPDVQVTDDAVSSLRTGASDGDIRLINNGAASNRDLQRNDMWIQFPSIPVGDQVDVRVVKTGTVDQFWWAISTDDSQANYVDPTNANGAFSQSLDDGNYTYSTSSTSLLGDPSSEDFPLGDSMFSNASNEWERTGDIGIENSGAGNQWTATVTVNATSHAFILVLRV